LNKLICKSCRGLFNPDEILQSQKDDDLWNMCIDCCRKVKEAKRNCRICKCYSLNLNEIRDVCICQCHKGVLINC